VGCIILGQVSIHSLKLYLPSAASQMINRRFLNLGCPERSSLIDDPSSNALLPADDRLWDNTVRLFLTFDF
jgi:hypothetical protein